MSAINKINIINQLEGKFDLLILGVNQNSKKLSFPSGVPVDVQDDLNASFGKGEFMISACTKPWKSLL